MITKESVEAVFNRLDENDNMGSEISDEDMDSGFKDFSDGWKACKELLRGELLGIEDADSSRVTISQLNNTEVNKHGKS